MVTPEPSCHTTGRLKHSNTEEAEKKIYLECNFVKMMETIKKEKKNSLKEMEEKANKKIGRNQ